MTARHGTDAAARGAQEDGPAAARAAARHAFWRLWGWPLMLGALTAVGLVSALFSDGGIGDWLAWLTLGVPTVAGIWFGWMRRAPRA